MEVVVDNVCVKWDCQAPATTGVWCATHAGEASGPKAISEPALEARLAAMADEPPPPPALDQGDQWQPRPVRMAPTPDPVPSEPLDYIQACLAGRHGAIAKMTAEVLVKAMAAALADL